jgi:hypothetical protein
MMLSIDSLITFMDEHSSPELQYLQDKYSHSDDGSLALVGYRRVA